MYTLDELFERIEALEEEVKRLKEALGIAEARADSAEFALRETERLVGDDDEV